MIRSIVVLLGFLTLSACAAIPRGAALQSEILSQASDLSETATPEFAVEIVSRSNVTSFLGWPLADSAHYHWINRVDQPNNRIIAAGDTLNLTIWTNEDNGLLTTTGQRFVALPPVQVSPSGSVFLPYVGNVAVRGMSPESARERISEAYDAVSPSAQVQLELQEGRGRTVSLISGVSQPGTFTLPHNDYTLLELIADGGGISSSLNNPQMRLQRNGTTYGISASRLLETPRFNTTMVAGDRVFVESDERSFLSLGAAGTEAIHPFPTESVTAIEALAIIGGVTDTRADAGGILILRRYPVSAVRTDGTGPSHPRTVFTVDLTTADGLFSASQFDIQSGDVVYVTESPVTAIGSILGLVGATFGLANQLN